MTKELITVDQEDRFAVMSTNKVEPFIPAGFLSVIRFSELISLSGLAPKGMEKADQIAGAIFYGLEIGMTPMAAIQSIAIINGRPSIWGDGALGLVRGSGHLEDIEESYEGTFPEDDFKAVCKITRKGAKRPVIQEFSIADAKRAGLWTKANTPWITYPKRMLKMRARSWAMRDEFTDVLRGLTFAEEAQDFENLRDITPEKDPVPPGAAAKDDDAADSKPKRTRTAKPNKFQEDDAAGKTIEGETVTTTVEAKETDKPAETEKEPTPPVKKEEAKPVDKPADKPKESPKEERVETVVDLMKPILDKASTNKPLRDYLTYLDKHFGAASTYDSLKENWKSRTAFQGTKSEQDLIAEVRDIHKERVRKLEEAAAPEADPSPPAEQIKPVTFDYGGFLHDLDVQLGAIETADEISLFYSTATALPIKEGLITEEQEENDLKPMLAGHLDRVSFGG